MKISLIEEPFLKAGLILSAATLVAPTVLIADVPVEEEGFEIAVGPYLQTNFNNEMTILWLTNANAAGWVEYGEQPDQINQKAYGKAELGLMQAKSMLNVVTLKKLKPGTKYYYNVAYTALRK